MKGWERLFGVLGAAALLMLSASTGLLSDDAAKGGDVSDLFGKTGRQPKQFGWIHQMACPGSCCW